MLSSDERDGVLITSSDASGAYVFADVDPGMHQLTVIFAGNTYDTSVEARGGFETLVNCRFDRRELDDRAEPLFVDPPVTIVPAQLGAR